MYFILALIIQVNAEMEAVNSFLYAIAKHNHYAIRNYFHSMDHSRSFRDDRSFNKRGAFKAIQPKNKKVIQGHSRTQLSMSFEDQTPFKDKGRSMSFKYRNDTQGHSITKVHSWLFND